MSYRRAAQYTWKAFLTFLMIGIPGILIQMGSSWFLSSQAWRNADGDPNYSLMGAISAAQVVTGLWVQFAVIFVIFKYAPSAIVEVLENREIARARQSSEVATNLEQ
ncbi:MAG: hypothetical protein HQ477_09800 [Chloroflexi bacterium]|nr:hypothetical protein [Chloroflexota bacterium]